MNGDGIVHRFKEGTVIHVAFASGIIGRSISFISMVRPADSVCRLVLQTVCLFFRWILQNLRSLPYNCEKKLKNRKSPLPNGCNDSNFAIRGKVYRLASLVSKGFYISRENGPVTDFLFSP